MAGVPANASAVALNVTATDARAAGYVTVYPTGGTRPLASNLNVEQAGQTIANFVVVPLGTNSSVSIYTQSGTHFVADVLGYFLPAQNSASGRYRALTPFRMLDTRDGTGTSTGRKTGAVTFTLPDTVPAGADSVLLNLTATAAQRAGHVTSYATGTPKPGTSSLNFTPGSTQANLVLVELDADRQITLDVHSGPTHVIADLVGYFTGQTAETPRRVRPLLETLNPWPSSRTRSTVRPTNESSTSTWRAPACWATLDRLSCVTR